MNKEIALLCAGPFWYSQLKLSKIKGVIKTIVGYSGGNLPFPTYMEVSTGNTGHVEAIEIIYDADIVSFSEILEEFWKVHDPISLHQNEFVGNQYRSTIFYFNEDQKNIAEASRAKAQSNYDKKLLTDIKIATKFYEAEEMHQYYFLKHER